MNHQFKANSGIPTRVSRALSSYRGDYTEIPPLSRFTHNFSVLHKFDPLSPQILGPHKIIPQFFPIFPFPFPHKFAPFTYKFCRPTNVSLFSHKLLNPYVRLAFHHIRLLEPGTG